MSDADNGLPFDAWGQEGNNDGHPDDTKWAKYTADTSARVSGPVMGTQICPRSGDAATTRIKVLEVGKPANVSVATAVDATVDGADIELGVSATLSPSQAEGLADALYEDAERAREYQEEHDD